MKISLASIYPTLTKTPTSIPKSVAVIHNTNAVKHADLAAFQEACPRITVGVYDGSNGEFHPLSSGSGVVLSKDGFVLTAKHVVDPNRNLRTLAKLDDAKSLLDLQKTNGFTYLVEIPKLDNDGHISSRTHTAILTSLSPEDDLAALAIDLDTRVDNSSSSTADLKYVTINPDFMKPDERVYTLGHALAYPENTLSRGRIFELNQDQAVSNLASHRSEDQSFLQVMIYLSENRASIPPDKLVSTNFIATGSSGGLLANSDGELVGVPVRYIMTAGDNETDAARITTVSENPRVVQSFLEDTLPRPNFNRLMSGKEVDTLSLLATLRRRHSFFS